MIPNLYIVVLNWNQKQATNECLDSLLQAKIIPEQIILVDNGSSDGSVEFFKKKYSNRLHLIENPNNRGYAYPSNQGMENAMRLGANWIFLLN